MLNTTAAKKGSYSAIHICKNGSARARCVRNGPQFVLGKFKHFTEINDIRHEPGAPYHPSTNGLAERIIQSFKNTVKADSSDRSIQHKLYIFLHSATCYNGPQSSSTVVWYKSEGEVGSSEAEHQTSSRWETSEK